MKNVLIVLSGPSGVGKGTVAKRLLENKERVFSISCTTRLPRKGEVNGREYFFISKEEFLDRIKKDGFLEYSEHFGNYYGTPRDFIDSMLEKKDVVLDLDVDGALNVKKNFKDALLIMLLPPSVDEIRERLIRRHTETEESIAVRMERIDYEISKKDKYDFVVVNDDLETAVSQVEQIINNVKSSADDKGE